MTVCQVLSIASYLTKLQMITGPLSLFLPMGQMLFHVQRWQEISCWFCVKLTCSPFSDLEVKFHILSNPHNIKNTQWQSHVFETSFWNPQHKYIWDFFPIPYMEELKVNLSAAFFHSRQYSIRRRKFNLSAAFHLFPPIFQLEKKN